MGRQCWRFCVPLLLCMGEAVAQIAPPGEAEPDRGAVMGMAFVVVGALVLVVAMLRMIGRRRGPVETAPAAAEAPEKRDLVAEAMAALDAAQAAAERPASPGPGGSDGG